MPTKSRPSLTVTSPIIVWGESSFDPLIKIPTVSFTLSLPPRSSNGTNSPASPCSRHPCSFISTARRSKASSTLNTLSSTSLALNRATMSRSRHRRAPSLDCHRPRWNGGELNSRAVSCHLPFSCGTMRKRLGPSTEPSSTGPSSRTCLVN
jgi:hypothetical protein